MFGGIKIGYWLRTARRTASPRCRRLDYPTDLSGKSDPARTASRPGPGGSRQLAAVRRESSRSAPTPTRAPTRGGLTGSCRRYTVSRAYPSQDAGEKRGTTSTPARNVRRAATSAPVVELGAGQEHSGAVPRPVNPGGRSGDPSASQRFGASGWSFPADDANPVVPARRTAGSVSRVNSR